MAAIRFGLIGRYLRPYRRTVLLGVAALVVVDREEDGGREKVEAQLDGAPLHALFTARELLAL